MWQITIPSVVTPTQNKWQVMHWAQKSKLKKAWGRWLHLHALEQEVRIPRAEGKRKVVVDRYGLKECDHDNLVSPAGKLILDPMRCRQRRKVAKKMIWIEGGLGWIVDDSPAWVEFEITNTIVNAYDDQKTVITIIPCSPHE